MTNEEVTQLRSLEGRHVSVALKGGSRITAERALDYGRPVLAIPGSRRNASASSEFGWRSVPGGRTSGARSRAKGSSQR